jgi:hypothetical protein
MGGAGPLGSLGGTAVLNKELAINGWGILGFKGFSCLVLLMMLLFLQCFSFRWYLWILPAQFQRVPWLKG